MSDLELSDAIYRMWCARRGSVLYLMMDRGDAPGMTMVVTAEEARRLAGWLLAAAESIQRDEVA